MTRKVSKFFIFAISILIAELLQAYVMHFLPHFRDSHQPYQATALKMLATVIIYVPLMALAGSLVEKTTSLYIEKSKSVAGSRLLGLLMGALIAFLILFGLFLKIDYKINLITVIRKAIYAIF